MFAYFTKVLRLVKPYKTRFVLGILCGFLSGLFTPALPLAAKVAVRVIFEAKKAAANPGAGTVQKTEKPPEIAAPAPPVAASVGTNPPAPAPSAGTSVVGAKSKTTAFLDKWLLKISPSGQPTSLLIIVVISCIPLVMLIRGVLGYLNIYLLAWVAIRAIYDLRQRMFEHVMGLSMTFFNRTSTGDLMARIYETTLLQNTITNSIAVIIREPISVLSLLAVLLIQQTKLTLITLIVFPVCVVPVVVYGRKLRKSTQAIQENASDISTVMHEAFTGSRIIKAYNLENTVIEQFKRSTRMAISFYMKVVRASEIPGPLIELFGAVGVAMFFVYFAFLTDASAGPDELLQFVISIFLIYPPIKSLSRLHSQVVMAQLVYGRVEELLNTHNTIPEPAHPVPLRAAGADIHFENVDFNYGDKPVLRNIELTVKASQLVALVGGSGAGKTTITSLLLRFYDPQSGRIRIGSTDIRDVTTLDLRSQMAVVTQETILFNETIRKNIALGRPGATDAEIEEAARHAHAWDFIMEKPRGLDTVVGEKGALLSGGQKQRVAIARAILKNAPILVLDEATSALDTESERAVQAALEELMQGRTTICIAHRLSTIYKADLIVVLHEGRIVETGTHDQLLAKDGHYRKLYEMQFQA